VSFDDKRLSFGGAGGGVIGAPWGVLGQITARALEPYGYALTVNPEAMMTRNPRMVAAGDVDFGATRAANARAAYLASGGFEGEQPRTNLRAVAAIQHPSWEAIAVRWETGITSLADIKERRMPVRVIGGGTLVARTILAHFGLSRELIESWGGRFQEPLTPGGGSHPHPYPWVRSGDFDVIMGNVFSGFAPEVWQIHEASILHNLHFLPLPEALIQQLCKEQGGEPGAIPHHLLRGIEVDVPSVLRSPQIIYGRDDMPDEFAHLLAKALDEGAHLFPQAHLAFSYNWRLAAKNTGVPLHPGALRFYQERGFPL
jgi:TRAP-type uncharacterized transport system substrate-binding protein